MLIGGRTTIAVPHRRGDNDIAERYAADADRAIAVARRGRHDQPAMFIADAGFLTNGVLDAPKGYLQGVYDRVRKAGGVAIADEVQTGFGRQGDAMWGFHAARRDARHRLHGQADRQRSSRWARW